jgi:hypothetical protein
VRPCVDGKKLINSPAADGSNDAELREMRKDRIGKLGTLAIELFAISRPIVVIRIFVLSFLAFRQVHPCSGWRAVHDIDTSEPISESARSWGMSRHSCPVPAAGESVGSCRYA